MSWAATIAWAEHDQRCAVLPVPASEPERLNRTRCLHKCMLGLLYFNCKVSYCRVRTPCITTPGEVFMVLISLPSPMITMFELPSESVAHMVQSDFTVDGPG